ncbi:MAG: VanZ family protein [Otoolea sp.]|nr:VanZ family protein [Clostridiaceae bacterium]MDD6072938.1 VanZ family protein [Clostridium sp.]MDY5485064.1 VanZ family protein [Clostridium sp.]
MRKQRWMWRLLLSLYICFLFSNSLTPAVQSSEASGRALQLIHQLLSVVGVQALWLTEHVLRKCAHFAEYTVLGLVLSQNVRLLSCPFSAKVLLHILFGFLIPFVDETLQLFTEGRSGQISDVWLDGCGVWTGTLVFLCLFFVWKHWKRSIEQQT